MAALGEVEGAVAPEHAARTRTRIARSAAGVRGGAARAVEENDGNTKNLRRLGSGGVRDESQNPSLRHGSKEGLIGRSHGFCLPFSRRFEHAPCGRRPDSRSRGSAHRSGTVLGSHQLRDHTAWSGKVTRRAPGRPMRALSAALLAHAPWGALATVLPSAFAWGHPGAREAKQRLSAAA